MSEADDATRQDKPLRQSQPKLETLPDFGPRYRVIGALGKGGMGEVFRAYDTELKVEVALKIVRHDHDHEAALARFRREIALARKVTSPHVLRVYDLAEHDGLRFLSMELVDGEDLGALMKREKKMPIERAVALFRQVCEGLVAAHAQGVVHRDLKPQNVLVGMDDRVRVADFGLARSIGDSGLTQSGALLGSPGYMSPEQVRGDDTDERSDIYSLGIMLYQLVTGEPPFQAPTAHAVMEMRLHKKPKLLRDVRSDAPANLEAICAKCLALAPSARYASVRDVLVALGQPAERGGRRARPRWLVPAVAAVPALAIVAYIAWPRSHGQQVTPPPPIAPPAPAADGPLMVLVLGFENRALEPLFDHTLDVAFESVLRRSTRIDPYAGTELQQLANELGPDTAVDEQLGPKLATRDRKRIATARGVITTKGSGYTLSISVTDASTGQVLFEAKADVSSRDGVLPTLARLASQFRERLGEKVAEDERERTGLSPVLEADHEYGIGHAMERADDMIGAIAHFEQALAKDPKFARAHASLAINYSNIGRLSEAGRESRFALQYMDQLAERDRLKALADYYDAVSADYDRAIQTYEKVLAIWPTDLSSQTNLSLIYLETGDVQKALELGERAIHDHPRDVILRANQGEAMVQAGQFERAIHDIQDTVASFSRPPETVFEALGISYLMTGDRARAIAAYDEFYKLDPSRARMARADLAIAEGRLGDARKQLDDAVAADRKAGALDAVEVDHTMLAQLALRRGDRAGARAAAEAVTMSPVHSYDAAIVLLALGDKARALATADRLAKDSAPSHRALAKWIEGEALRVQGKPEEAMIAIQDGLKLFDLPAGHFRLALAALDAKRYPEAYGELQHCLQQRGRMAIDNADLTMYRAIAETYYYVAKAQEGLGSDATKAYRDFLAILHDPDPDDPLSADAKKHAPR